MTIRMALKRPVHPALIRHTQDRAQYLQIRIADAITRFAGSRPFIYVQVVWFSLWIATGVEACPFGLLTMIVSLEAIFLSTFVMTSHNPADEKRQALADHEWELVQLEQKQNNELIDMSHQLLALTQEVHRITSQVHELVQGPGGRSED